MATFTRITGFEYGCADYRGNGIWDYSDGSCVIDSAIKRTGTYSLKTTATVSTGAWFSYQPVGTPTSRVGAAHVYFDDLPAGNQCLVAFTIASGYFINISLQGSDHHIFIGQDLTFTYDTSYVFAADTWYCLEFRINVSANPWTFDLRINAIAQTQRTFAHSASTVGVLNLGLRTSNDAVAYWDDIALSQTPEDHPLVPNGLRVFGIKPSGDGTHNPGTNIMEDNDGNDVGAVTAYDHLDDIPMSGSVDYIRQYATGAGNYAEVTFEDLNVGSTILGVQAMIAFLSGSPGTPNSGVTNAYDADSQLTTVYSGDMSVSDAMTYKAAIITTPTGGWTLAQVNALKMRIGYSTNVASQPRWHALMFEVATTQQALVKIINE